MGDDVSRRDAAAGDWVCVDAFSAAAARSVAWRQMCERWWAIVCELVVHAAVRPPVLR